MREAPIWRSHIESRPEVMVGKPCIRGTRVTVEAILNSVGVTGSVQATAAEYPHITEEDVRAALFHAVDALWNDDLQFLEP
jgi:uncharacterized protein (DUF433 family)